MNVGLRIVYPSHHMILVDLSAELHNPSSVCDFQKLNAKLLISSPDMCLNTSDNQSKNDQVKNLSKKLNTRHWKSTQDEKQHSVPEQMLVFWDIAKVGT